MGWELWDLDPMLNQLALWERLKSGMKRMSRMVIGQMRGRRRKYTSTSSVIGDNILEKIEELRGGRGKKKTNK